jgi:hypothetical protein
MALAPTLNDFYTSNLYTCARFLIKLIETTNFQILSNEEYDTFIKKLISGKSRSIMHYANYYGVNKLSTDDTLLQLVKKRIPTVSQVDKILACFLASKVTSYTWIEYIIDKGYILSKKQLNILILAGYQKSLDTIIDTIECPTLDIVLKSNNIYNNLEAIEKVALYHKTIITNVHLQIIVDNMYANIIGNTYDTKMAIIISVLEKFIKLKFNPDSESLIIVIDKYKTYNNAALVKCITLLLTNPIIITHNVMKLVGSLASQYSTTKFYFEIIKLLLASNYVATTESYKIITISVFNKDIVELYLQFIKTISEIHKIKPNVDTLVFACEIGNVTLFDFCITQKIVPTIDCMYAICKNYKNNASYDLLLEQLLNMKLLPDNQCISIAIKARCNNCIKVLLQYGGYINLDLVSEMIGTKYAETYALPDLEAYDIPYDDNIYALCHKFDCYPLTVINKLSVEKTVIKLREMCKASSIVDIEKYIQQHKLNYDKFCYDNLLYSGVGDKINIALKALDDKIYKIDKISVLRLPSTYDIMQYYDKYFKL